MRKSTQLSSKQMTSRIKFTKHQSHQINPSNLSGLKNTNLPLTTSPSNSKKNIKDRIFSPSEQVKEKNNQNKQKLKNLQIFSPNTKNKAKLDLDIKSSIFEKNPDSLRQNKKLRNSKEKMKTVLLHLMKKEKHLLLKIKY